MSAKFIPSKGGNKAKAKRQLIAEWAAIEDKWSSVPKFSRNLNHPSKAAPMMPINAETNLDVETTKVYKSLVTPGGSTALKSKKVYTGDKIIGLAVLHKSNTVPIFNLEAAVDAAKMRR